MSHYEQQEGEKEEQDVLVLHFLLLLVFEPAKLKGTEVTATLETQGSDKPLNLWTVNVVHISYLYFPP